MADANDNPAPEAEDTVVEEVVETTDAPTEPTNEQPKEEVTEVSDAEQDALNSISDVKGDVTPNDVAEPEPEVAPEPEEEVEEAEEPETPEPGPAEAVAPPEPVPAAATPPVEPLTAIDPGDFKPGDYSFEVTTTDGKTRKIATPEDADKFAQELDDNPELISASQFVSFNRGVTKMDVGVEGDQKAWQEMKEGYETQEKAEELRQKTVAQWDKEINYLRERGDLPKGSADLNNANWSDPKVAADPSVKAVKELFDWMEAENNRRMGVGLEPVQSVVDAFNSKQLEDMRQQDKDRGNKEVSRRRSMGARVSGGSPYVPTNTPKGSIVGTGGTLDDLLTDYQYSQ